MGSPLQKDAWEDTYADRCEAVGLDEDCLTLNIRVTDEDGVPIAPAPEPDDPTGPNEYTDANGNVYSSCDVSSMNPDPELVNEVPVPSAATINVACVPLG